MEVAKGLIRRRALPKVSRAIWLVVIRFSHLFVFQVDVQNFICLAVEQAGAVKRKVLYAETVIVRDLCCTKPGMTPEGNGSGKLFRGGIHNIVGGDPLLV